MYWISSWIVETLFEILFGKILHCLVDILWMVLASWMFTVMLNIITEKLFDEFKNRWKKYTKNINICQNLYLYLRIPKIGSWSKIKILCRKILGLKRFFKYNSFMQKYGDIYFKLGKKRTRIFHAVKLQY